MLDAINPHLQPHTSRPSALYFTCNTCSIQFPLAVLQREHMKTEWHRYNLKRRLALLGPLTADVFAAKVLAKKAQEKYLPEVEDEYGFVVHNKVASGAKQVTKKEMRKREKYQRGIALNRPASPISVHSAFSLGGSTTGDDTGSELNFTDEMETSEGEASVNTMEESDLDLETADEDEFIEISECIFCGTIHASVEQSADHMYKKHGLYLPERNKLRDLTGLVQHLINAIIDNGNRCLNCTFTGRSLESVRQHMLSKHHCQLQYDTKEERETINAFYDFGDEALDDDEDDEGSQYQTVEVDPSGVEMVLPTGGRIGHRSMSRYYRQNLSQVAERADDGTVAVADGRNNGAGLVGEVVSKDVKMARTAEIRCQQKMEISIRFKAGKKNRGNAQTHFRDPLLQ